MYKRQPEASAADAADEPAGAAPSPAPGTASDETATSDPTAAAPVDTGAPEARQDAAPVDARVPEAAVPSDKLDWDDFISAWSLFEGRYRERQQAIEAREQQCAPPHLFF